MNSLRKNLGAFTEELVNKTIKFYLENDLCFFCKAYIPTTIFDGSGSKKYGRILKKANLDYYGVYKGQYISFEVKECGKEIFRFEKIKDHQLSLLEKINQYGGNSFLLLNFVSHEEQIWIIPYSSINKLIKKNQKHIKRSEISEYGFQVPIIYPGVLDLIQYIEK